MAIQTVRAVPGRSGSCEGCAFWDRRNARIGLCRAAAPRTHAIGETEDDIVVRALWPITGVNDWCGQWRPANATR